MNEVLERLANSPQKRQLLSLAERFYELLTPGGFLNQTLGLSAQNQIVKLAKHTFTLTEYNHIVLLGLGADTAILIKQIQTLLPYQTVSAIIFSSKAEFEQQYEQLVRTASGLTAQSLCVCVVGADTDFIDCSVSESLVLEKMQSAGTLAEYALVRKHLGRFSGGGLAKVLAPAQIVYLNVSGDSHVWGQPLELDPTTMYEASSILKRYNILQLCGVPNCRLAETPKERSLFSEIFGVLVTGETVALWAGEIAKDLGLATKVLAVPLGDLPSYVTTHDTPGSILFIKEKLEVVARVLFSHLTPEYVANASLLVAQAGSGLVIDNKLLLALKQSGFNQNNLVENFAYWLTTLPEWFELEGDYINLGTFVMIIK